MKRVTVTTAALVATVLSLAACGGDLTVDGRELVNAKTFMATADETFTEAVSELRANHHRDARCYYVTEKNRLTGAVCGPVRPFGARDGEVWWPLTYKVKRDSDGAQLAQPEVADRPAKRPPGKLSRPDGDDPPGDADKLAAPQAPPGPAGLVTTDVSEVGFVEAKRPANGKLIGPTYAITVVEAGQAAYVQQRASGDPEPVGPAPGETLYAAKLSFANANEPPDNDVYSSEYRNRSLTTTYTLILGETRKDVTSRFGRSGERTLVVSAPTGVEPRLEAQVDGQGQAISLATGERVTTTAKAYYRANPSYSVNQQYNERLTVGEHNFTATLTVATATVTPFSAKLGWAPAGRAWLVVLLKDTEVREANYRSTSRTLLGDRSYKLATGGAAHQLKLALDGVLVFDVPEDLTAADLTVSYTFSFTSSYEPRAGTAVFPARTYPVTIPA